MNKQTSSVIGVVFNLNITFDRLQFVVNYIKQKVPQSSFNIETIEKDKAYKVTIQTINIPLTFDIGKHFAESLYQVGMGKFHDNVPIEIIIGDRVMD